MPSPDDGVHTARNSAAFISRLIGGRVMPGVRLPPVSRVGS